MEQTLRNIVAKIAEVTPDFEADARLNEKLNVDSVRALEIVFEIEKAFGISVPEDRYAAVRTFSDLVKLITSLRS